MKKNKEDGYSLIELLIAIQLLAIVISFSYTIYFYSIKFIGKWEQNNDLINSQVVINRALNSKLNSFKKIIEITENRLLMDCGEMKETTILWKKNTVLLNDKPIISNNGQVRIKAFQLYAKVSQKIKPVSIEDLDTDDNNRILSDELRTIRGFKLTFILVAKDKTIEYPYLKMFNISPL
jgi:prepilin-type N-terminal cleavage/methylation domain-containing protein